MSEALPDYLPKKFRRIHLELTNRCNFSCAFCPDGKMTRKRGTMDVALAFSALDQIADLDLAEKVTFHVMGEPLLHPQFFSILDHARERGISVGLTTNGALLRPDTIQKLADRDLFQIDISLQTPDPESFHATRGGRIAFDAYREGLLDLLAACAARPEPPVFKIRIMTTRFAGRMKEKLGIPDFMGSSALLRRTVLEWTDRIYDRLGLVPVPTKDPAQENREDRHPRLERHRDQPPYLHRDLHPDRLGQRFCRRERGRGESGILFRHEGSFCGALFGRRGTLLYGLRRSDLFGQFAGVVSA